MYKSVLGIVRSGRIELIEPIFLSEGTKLLVTLLSDEEDKDFWLQVSDRVLISVWENEEDDIYAKLLQV